MKAVLVSETFGNICEIELDIHPKKNEIFKIIKEDIAKPTTQEDANNNPSC